MKKCALGFDFGESRIGVAVGQTWTKTASPLDTVKAKNGQPNWTQIEQLVDIWKPDVFVVGSPINMDGSISQMSEKTEKFARQLTGRFKVPVDFVDERLSSVEAKEILGINLNQIKEKKSIKQKILLAIDAEAARIILVSWLDAQL